MCAYTDGNWAILALFSSMLAPEVAHLTTLSLASDDQFVQMTTFLFNIRRIHYSKVARQMKLNLIGNVSTIDNKDFVFCVTTRISFLCVADESLGCTWRHAWYNLSDTWQVSIHDRCICAFQSSSSSSSSSSSITSFTVFCYRCRLSTMPTYYSYVFNTTECQSIINNTKDNDTMRGSLEFWQVTLLIAIIGILAASMAKVFNFIRKIVYRDKVGISFLVASLPCDLFRNNCPFFETAS